MLSLLYYVKTTMFLDIYNLFEYHNNYYIRKLHVLFGDLPA